MKKKHRLKRTIKLRKRKIAKTKKNMEKFNFENAFNTSSSNSDDS